MLRARAILAVSISAAAICGCSNAHPHPRATSNRPVLVSSCIYTPSNADPVQIASGAPGFTVNVALGIAALQNTNSVYVRSVTVLLYGTPGVSVDKKVIEPVNKTIGMRTVVLQWPASGVLAQHTICQVQGYTAG